MNRVALLASLLVSSAACSPQQPSSLCLQDPPPAACAEACDPNGANSCPGGYHCTAAGTCDAECTPGGSECPSGQTCASDGRCEDTGGGGPDASCPDLSFTATAIRPSISLLIDRSRSMLDPIGGISRYNAIKNALIDPTNGVVTTLQNRAFFGASLYSTDSPCPKLYSVPRAIDNRDTIANLINSQSPDGNTPTGPSIDQAVAAFAASPAPADSPPVIVLATDGLPNNCAGTETREQEAINAATAAFAAGIRLFILGVGTGINDTHLQAMANAGAGVQGGQPNAPFYLANSPQQLADAFNAIIGGVISCDLTLNGMIDETQAAGGTVLLNGAPLTYGTDWELANGTTVRLLGNACSTLKSSANPTVTASFPCGAVIL